MKIKTKIPSGYGKSGEIISIPKSNKSISREIWEAKLKKDGLGLGGNFSDWNRPHMSIANGKYFLKEKD